MRQQWHTPAMHVHLHNNNNNHNHNHNDNHNDNDNTTTTTNNNNNSNSATATAATATTTTTTTSTTTTTTITQLKRAPVRASGDQATLGFSWPYRRDPMESQSLEKMPQRLRCCDDPVAVAWSPNPPSWSGAWKRAYGRASDDVCQCSGEAHCHLSLGCSGTAGTRIKFGEQVIEIPPSHFAVGSRGCSSSSPGLPMLTAQAPNGSTGNEQPLAHEPSIGLTVPPLPLRGSLFLRLSARIAAEQPRACHMTAQARKLARKRIAIAPSTRISVLVE